MSAYTHSQPAAVQSTSTVFGQVMALVAIALGFCTAGAFIGENLQESTARICSFAGLGMLIAQSFVPALRRGPLGIGWLCALALLIGLGLAPFVGYVAEVQPDVLSKALGGTALTVVGMAALGFTLSKDLVSWMRPLSLVVLVAVVISIVSLVVGGIGTLSPVLSVIIFVAAAGLIAVDFNFIRKHGTENDVIWLATGIFVSIVNIFISLLNLFSR
jgi:modulator of FtsH protease